MDLPMKLVLTDDGSHSLYREDLHESYHSLHGARSESNYVFIDKGLNFLLDLQPEIKSINLLEVGLGTGLNAWLTALWANENKIKIQYIGLEPFPVPENISRQLNYPRNESEKLLLDQIHATSWGEAHVLTPFFILHKLNVKLEDYFPTTLSHLIYFDAFAPSKQAEVWSEANIQKCYQSLLSGGILVTYCAQGQFKRNLTSSGFMLEVLSGALGKKEMVRGIKSS